MIEFRKMTAEDGQWARPLLAQGGFDTCEYSFADIFMWSTRYDAHIAHWNDFMTVRSQVGETCQYLYPAGLGDRRAALEEILTQARDKGCRVIFYGLPDPAKRELEAWFPGMFTFQDQRDHYDYLYLAGDLAELPGKKFQKKRNHVSRFVRENPDWQFQPITPENMPLVRQFSEQWYLAHPEEENCGITEEHTAADRALDHFEALGLQGGVLLAGGRVVAYSFGSFTNDRVFNTQVEKARADVNGAYAMINREMARFVQDRCEWIDREDDVGDEGLRKAKLSYQPALLLQKWLAEQVSQLPR